MSDPVTNAEVEDVLSSIRRLVSEDKRPMPSAKEPQSEPENDKLVLTPALRVAEEPENPSPTAERVAETLESTEEPPRASAPPPEPLPEVRQHVPDLDDLLDREDEVSFEQADEDDEVVVVRPAEDDAGNSADPADDYSDDPYGFEADDDDGDSDPEVSQDHAASDEPEADELPVGRGDDAGRDAEDDLLASLRASDEPPLPEAEEPDHPEGQAEEAPETAFTAKIEALETAIGKIEDGWEPDGEGPDENAAVTAPAMDWPTEGDDTDDPGSATPSEPEAAFDAEQEPEPEPEGAQSPEAGAVDEGPEAESDNAAQQAGQPDGTKATLDIPIPPRPAIPEGAPEKSAAPVAKRFEDPFDDAAESQVIDEEALRDLVSEIVRSELQGALGERITRNVRKLVRREIHRALTAQELE